MTVVPRYSFLPGTEITLHNRPMVISGNNPQGYTVVGREDGEATLVPYAQLVELLKLPGVKIDADLPKTGNRNKQRLGGYATSQALTEDQRETGRFRFALCQAMTLYRTMQRRELGDPDFDLSHRKADRSDVRKFIATVAGGIPGRTVRTNAPRGGTSTNTFLYRGRTLMEYFRIYESLEPWENPIYALVSLDRQKGNRTIRICERLRELMTEAWEHVGLDLKCPRTSQVQKHLEATVRQENQMRARNNLDRRKIRVPSHRALREHLDLLLTPTEQLVATKGVRDTRNKRGRGSTDLRALLIGEEVELDECKMSLVTSAKMAGFWERMSVDAREALAELEEYIRSRF